MNFDEELYDVYTKECEFTYSDLDIFDNVFPKVILQKLQDVAGEHAQLLGFGYDKFKSNGLIWVIVRTSYTILKKLLSYKKYLIKTFPMVPKGFNYQRDYVIIDKETSEVVLKGTSIWCIVNINTRRLVKSSDLVELFSNLDTKYVPSDYACTPLKSLNKNVDRNENKTCLVQKVLFSFLDHNLHMNNTYYADLIISSLDLDESTFIKELQINYEKECVKDDTLYLYKVSSTPSSLQEDGVDSSTYNIVGLINDADVCFTSKITLEKNQK